MSGIERLAFGIFLVGTVASRSSPSANRPAP
jgi:hypothetical protein